MKTSTDSRITHAEAHEHLLTMYPGGAEEETREALVAYIDQRQARETELLEANTRLHNEKVDLRNEADHWRGAVAMLELYCIANGLDPKHCPGRRDTTDRIHIIGAVAALEG